MDANVSKDLHSWAPHVNVLMALLSQEIHVHAKKIFHWMARVVYKLADNIRSLVAVGANVLEDLQLMLTIAAASVLAINSSLLTAHNVSQLVEYIK